MELEFELWSKNWITTEIEIDFEMELEHELKLLSEKWIRIEIEIIYWTDIALLVYVIDVNSIGDKSRLSATENFETVLSVSKCSEDYCNSLDLSPILFTPVIIIDIRVFRILIDFYMYVNIGIHYVLLLSVCLSVCLSVYHPLS